MPEARIVQYEFTNLTPGEGSDVNDAADANEFNTNWSDISVALGWTRFRGAPDCINRASGAANANFYLRTQSLQNRLGAITAGYFALVCDDVAGDYWEDVVQVDGVGPFLDISDADYTGDNGALPGCTGAYTTEFSNWEIYVVPMDWKISKDWLILDYLSPGALLGTDIAVSNTIITDIGTYIVATRTRVDVALDGAGNLNADIVTNASLDKDEVLFYNSDNSIAMGVDAEEFPYGDGIAYGLELLEVAEWGGPPDSQAKDTTIVRRGLSSQKFTTSTDPTGFKVIRKNRILATDDAGYDVTICIWVYVPGGENMNVGFVYDAGAGYVASVTPTATGAATWQKIMHTTTLPAGTIDWYGVIASDADVGAATVYYVDDIDIFRGNVGFAITGSDNLEIVTRFMKQTYYNYIPFSDLSWFGDNEVGPVGRFNSSHAWLIGHDDAMSGGEWPNFWYSDTGVNSSDQRTDEYKVGNASWELDMDINDSVIHEIGIRSPGAADPNNVLINELSGSPASFGCYLVAATSACTEDVMLEIETVPAPATPIQRTFDLGEIGSLTTGDWKWCAVTADELPDDLTSVQVKVINPGTSLNDAEFLVDGFCLTKTDHPTEYISLTGWRYNKHDFGACTDSGQAWYVTVGAEGEEWALGHATMPPANLGADPTYLWGPENNFNEIPYGLTIWGTSVPVIGGLAPVISDDFELIGVYSDETALDWDATDVITTVNVTDTDGLNPGVVDSFYLTNIISVDAGGAPAPNRNYDRLFVKWTTGGTVLDGDVPCRNPMATVHSLYWGV